MTELRQRGAGASASKSTTTTTTDSSSTPNKKPRVVIVGGGPAGAAVAKSMADTGLYQVNLYEAYPHPAKIAKNAPKAYVIALSMRGQQGIQDATQITPSDVAKSVVSPTMVRHPKNRVMHHKDKPSLIVPRKDLTAHLLDQAAAAGAHIHLEHRLVALDVAPKRVVTFESNVAQAKTSIQVEYDLLIATDGCNSRIRGLLDEQADDFSVVRTEQDSMEYQVAVVAPTSEDGADGEDADAGGSVFPKLPATAVHVWNNAMYNSICLAFPLHKDNGGGMLFAIVFPEGKLEEFKAQHAKTGDGYDDALDALLPDVPAKARASIVEQLATGTPANGGVCVWTSALGSAQHGVVLVGDSGHGMWPSLGQGANCALESVAVFCQALHNVRHLLSDKNTTMEHWSQAVVEEFNKQRHEDAVAAVDLTYGGIGARKSRGRNNAPLSFKLQVAGMMLLNLLSAGLVPKPALLRIMAGDDLPYSKARQYNFYYEKVICLTALAVLVVGVPTFWRYNK